MKQRKLFGFPSNVFFLSVVSLFNDIGGETIKKTIPLYLSNVLGIPATVIGLIEGVTNALPQLLQPISGYVSDVTRLRKPLVVIGQVLRSLMVALFWVTSWPSIFVIRLLDRGGKGISEAPRDALVSGSAEQGHVGKAFGLTRMFDNAGAVIGLVLASGIVWYTSRNASAISVPLFHSIVLLSVIPLICNILILALLVHDVPTKPEKIAKEKRTGLARKFYYFLILSVIFTIGNSSDAFIILQSQRIGISIWMIFLLLAGYSFVSSISAVPLSSLSDRIGRKKLLIIGWIYYAVMYYAFAMVKTPLSMAVVILLYGAYYGFTEGSAKAYIADLVPQSSRGTAYGMYNMATGIALLCASVIAGYLWQAISPEAAFYFGSGTAVIAGIGLFFVGR